MLLKNWQNGLYWRVALLWGAIFLSYSNSFTIDFHFDDTHTIESNLFIRSLNYIPRYFVDAKTFSYRPENSSYRPMTTTALAIGSAISHQQPWGFHLIKLAQHCIVGLLVFLIGMMLLPSSISYRTSIAWVSALIFGVHTANTETVNYISAISSLQAGMFLLSGFYFYVLGRRKNKKAFIVVALFSYFLGMLSKEEGITLPAMLVLYEWFYAYKQKNVSYLETLKNHWKNILKKTALFWFAALIYVVLLATLEPAVADESKGDVPRFVYFITQWRAWLHYWILFFYPLNLNADNLAFGFSESLFDFKVIGALTAHVAIWFLAYHLGKRYRLIWFGVAWMYVTILPASSVFPLVEAVNEHRMYVPYVFLSILSTWGLFSLVEALFKKNQKVMLAALSFLIVSGLAVTTYARNEVWQTQISLWEDIYSKNPKSVRAMNVYGVALMKAGDHDKAFELFQRCHNMLPTYPACMVHLSMEYAYRKQYQKGLELLRYGVSIHPDYPHLNFYLGIYYKDYFGQYEKAKPYFHKVSRVTSGRMFQASLKLAEMAIEEKNFLKAQSLVDSVLQIDPTNAEAWEVFAKLQLVGGKIASAKKIFEELLKNVPRSPTYLLNVANVYERLGEYSIALLRYIRASQIEPKAIQAWAGIRRIVRKVKENPDQARNIAASLPATDIDSVESRIAELNKSNTYVFYPSMFFLDSKPRETGS